MVCMLRSLLGGARTFDGKWILGPNQTLDSDECLAISGHSEKKNVERRFIDDTQVTSSRHQRDACVLVLNLALLF